MPPREQPAVSAARVPIVLAFDIEPDDRVGIPAPGSKVDWSGVPATFDFVDGWRGRLAEATGHPAAFSWYVRMDPAITSLHGDPCWAAEAFGKRLDEMAAKGDAIGLHTHGLRWDTEQSTWVVDLGSEAWMRETIESSYAAYRDWQGVPCTLNRMGDWFLSDAMMEQLESLGVEIDLTLEPGQKPRPTNNPEAAHTGSLADYRDVERMPYRPSRGDFRHAANGAGDARRIWELPVLSVDVRPITPLARRIGRFIKHPFRPPYRPWPLWAPISGDRFWELIENDPLRLDRPCIVFASRSDTAIRDGGVDSFADKLEALIRRPLARSVRFVAPHEALRMLGLETGAETQPD